MTRVWDCFVFNWELDLLKFRLSELDECVDFFVLVEATKTFRGEPKTLHYAENKSRYRDFQNKIIHVVVDDMPTSADSPRVREKHQHAAITKGLVDVQPEDLVIVSDLDEIPRCGVVRELLSSLSEPTRLILNHSIYFANWKLPIQWDDGPMACRGNQLKDKSMALLLGQPEAKWGERTNQIFPNAGWHFSYLGGVNFIMKKFGEICHTELDNKNIRNSKYLNTCTQLGVDFRGKFILKILRESELDSMLEHLRLQCPEAFSFNENRNLLLAIVYRSYVHLRYLNLLPEKVVRIIDLNPIIFCMILAVPVISYDFSYRALVKYRVRYNFKKLISSVYS